MRAVGCEREGEPAGGGDRVDREGIPHLFCHPGVDDLHRSRGSAGASEGIGDHHGIAACCAGNDPGPCCIGQGFIIQVPLDLRAPGSGKCSTTLQHSGHVRRGGAFEPCAVHIAVAPHGDQGTVHQGSIADDGIERFGHHVLPIVATVDRAQRIPVPAHHIAGVGVGEEDAHGVLRQVDQGRPRIAAIGGAGAAVAREEAERIVQEEDAVDVGVEGVVERLPGDAAVVRALERAARATTEAQGVVHEPEVVDVAGLGVVPCCTGVGGAVAAAVDVAASDDGGAVIEGPGATDGHIGTGVRAAGGEVVGGAAVGTHAAADPSCSVGEQVYAQPLRIARVHVGPITSAVGGAHHAVLDAAHGLPARRGTVLFRAEAHLVEHGVVGADLHRGPGGAMVQCAVHTRLAGEQTDATGIDPCAKKILRVERLHGPVRARVRAAQHGAPAPHGQHHVAVRAQAEQAVRGRAGLLRPVVAAVGGADDETADAYADAVQDVEEVKAEDVAVGRLRHRFPCIAAVQGAEEQAARGGRVAALIINEGEGHDGVGGAAGLQGPGVAAIGGTHDLAALTPRPAQRVVHEEQTGHVVEGGLIDVGDRSPSIGGVIEAARIGGDDAALIVPHPQRAWLVKEVVGLALPAGPGIGGLQYEAEHAVDGEAGRGIHHPYGSQFAPRFHGRRQFPGLRGSMQDEEDRQEQSGT